MTHSFGSDREVSLEKKLDDLYKLIDGIETAMLTTRRPDGQLVSRAMRTQRRTSGTDLWFMTNAESEKFEEIAKDPNVNVTYFRDRTGEWVSVSGHAILSSDRDLIDSLYADEWKEWLPEVGDGRRNGTSHDPRIALILVEADRATYAKRYGTPSVLFQTIKAKVTGTPRQVADIREVGPDELDSAR